jgi:sugar lactone lactonase YvrE
VAAFTGQGKSMPVAFDDEIAWPLSWYFRDTTGFFGATPTRQSLDAPVVVVGQNNWQKVDNWIGADYHRYEVIRMWWPMEDYKDLTWQRIRFALTDPAMRSALWQILWNRNYAPYAVLTGENLDPPRQWPLQDRMRIYIRKDIADKMTNLKLAAYKIPDVQPTMDAYADVQQNIAPLRVLSGLSLNAPRNLALGTGGEIYVADSGNARIVRLNSAGVEIQSWGSKTPADQTPAKANTLNEPWGVALDPQGNLYVADTWNHRIQKFDSSGKFLLQWGQSGLASDGLDRFWGPRAVAISKDGKVIYVTDTGNKRVVAFDPNGKVLFQFDQGGQAQLDEPVGLAVGPDNNVYVADTWNQRVAIFDAQGHFLRSFPVRTWSSNSIDDKPYLAIDASGRVYVTDPQNFRVLVFSADGKPVAAFGSSDQDALTLPNGIGVASDGSIWVVDSGSGRLVQYPALK